MGDEVDRLTPVASASGPRSSQTYTEPERMHRRSSLSNRRDTIGKIPFDTA